MEDKSLFTEEPFKKRKLYEPVDMLNAYKAVTEGGLSVYRAARNYNVPESTLRDRTLGLVEPVNCKPGPERVFNYTEELDFVSHIKYMASIGYGYTKQEVIDLGTQYAIFKGSRDKDGPPLSAMWFYSFIKRHHDLELLKPRKLTHTRAKFASAEKIKTYFTELKSLMTKHGLHDKPHLIYNCDETGVSNEHNPPKVVGQRNSNVQAITSPRSFNVTVIGCGNAASTYIPPYYIFPAKRWSPDFLDGTSAGADGGCTETGWSNMAAFKVYLEHHFLKFAQRPNPLCPILLLYDGHKSHTSLFLTDWAKKLNIILFVLPPHTSHLLQPLDVGIFGPFKKLYNKECHSYLKSNPGSVVTKYQVGKLTNSPYLTAFSPQNLISAFRKTGVYPCENTVTDIQVAPATLYENKDDDGSDTETDGVIPESSLLITDFQQQQQQPEETNEQQQNKDIPMAPVQSAPTVVAHLSEDNSTSSVTNVFNFFTKQNITSAVKKSKRSRPESVVGDLSKKHNQAIFKSIKKSTTQPKFVTPWAIHGNINSIKSTSGTSTVSSSVNEGKRKAVKSKINSKNDNNLMSVLDPQPGTSGINKFGGPISTGNDSFSSDEDDIDGSEKCCVCHLFQPRQFHGCSSLVFLKWAQCDICDHWVHLIYCSSTRVIRRGDEFRCPHCI